ncbi:MAG: MoaA/NifB/PqqE/SkfB family radical SAM enzyme [Rhodothermales bacterium]|jgi:MoaA/NifB/PqqE/SkfB family radical SAM enzyme
MYVKMARRMLGVDKRLLWKLAYNFGWKGMLSVQRYKRRMKRNEYFPPFLYISVINSCNLQCKGCWVDVKAKQSRIDDGRLDKLLTQAKAAGNSFFGILGGEPFMHKNLLKILAKHPDAYFQIFTNGQLITPEIAQELHRLGNITPLVSIEGSDLVSDDRRGGDDVNQRSFVGLQNCLDAGLVTGVCTSIAANNIDDMLTEEWVDRLIDKGVHYMWFHTYRPIGPDPCEELALTPEQQSRIREYVVSMRCKKPIGIVDAYYDHEGKALCPAATGISHHISPYGDVEPCPIVQFAKETIDDERGIHETITQSEFLSDFRKLAAETTRGCIVLEAPDKLADLVEKHAANDTTVRKSAIPELRALKPRTSQYNPAKQIPERSWLYRFAKRFWFNDFGTYDGLH